MQQRVGLAQALINDPDLLIFDEPTSGLDPIGRMKVRQIIQRLKNEGRTVFFSSHELGEVETVCDRVAILNQGKLEVEGSVNELASQSRGDLGESSDVREILPWLRLSAELDPNSVRTYTVAAYWLRERMGKVAEAEQFLREGLRANPGSYAILFELG